MIMNVRDEVVLILILFCA